MKFKKIFFYEKNRFSICYQGSICAIRTRMPGRIDCCSRMAQSFQAKFWKFPHILKNFQKFVLVKSWRYSNFTDKIEQKKWKVLKEERKFYKKKLGNFCKSGNADLDKTRTKSPEICRLKRHLERDSKNRTHGPD